MKNIYELTKKEKEKFRKEFNKLNFTKGYNNIKEAALCIVIFGIILLACASGIYEDVSGNTQIYIDMFSTAFENLIFISFIIFIALDIYLDIIFMRWLKIKHEIQY